MTYLVTGATGTVGRWVVHHLLEMGHPVRALTRNPARASFPSSVEVVRGDMDDVDSLRSAFNGISAAHLIAFGTDEEPLQNGAAIVAAMQDAGIQRCTVLANWDDSTLQPALTAAGFPWTHLCPVEFMSNKIADWADSIRRDGVVREIGNGAGPLVHPADIGAVAARALTSDEHAGQEYLLTGPEALTASEQTAIIAETIGRDVQFIQMPVDEGADYFRSVGMPEEIVQLKIFLADPANFTPELLTPQPTVQQVTGRPALTFRQWAQENAGEFVA